MAEDKVANDKVVLLKSLEGQQLKQHIVHDASKRPIFIFEAPINARDGDPCLVTEYVYLDPTEPIVISRQERQYRWKEVWETGFTFDPATDYDLNGDGTL